MESIQVGSARWQVQGSRTGRKYSTTRRMSMLLPAFCSEAEVSATDASSEKNICIWQSRATASLPRSSYGSKCT